MSTSRQLKIRLELFWWLATLLVAIGILFPIWLRIPDFPFFLTNLIYILACITFTRYAFLLKHTFLARQQVIKPIFFFCAFPLVFYLVSELNYFQTFLDEEGVEAVVGNLPFPANQQMGNYIRNEMLLFGVGAIIATVVLALRLVVSFWRYRLKGIV